MGGLKIQAPHTDTIITPSYAIVLDMLYITGGITLHNHPSDDPEPSDDDLSLTRRLADAGRLMGIEVLDHIIITRKGYTSFKERGLL